MAQPEPSTQTIAQRLDDAVARGSRALRELSAVEGHEESVRALEDALKDVEEVARVLRAPPVERHPRARARVLVVDDDSWVADAIALELSEMDVVIALGGREALSMLRRDPDFDLVLCDSMMPDVSGVDLYETLEKESSPVINRFVFITGGVLTARTRIFLDRCHHPLMLKPFEPGSLLATVKEHTARAR